MSLPAAPPRETYRHGDVRAAAVRAGLAALEAGEDIAIRAVARSIGVAHRAVALQFTDRAGFEAALAAEGFARLADAVAEAQDRSGFLRAYLSFGLAQPRLYDLMMAQSYHAFESRPALRAAADRVIAAALARLAGAGDDEQTGRRAVMRLWMLAHGGLGLHRSGVLLARTDDAFITELMTIAGLEQGPPSSPHQPMWALPGSKVDV